VVVGSMNMDIVATTARYPARGETVRGESVSFHAGGKGANQAVAAARLGARACLIGCVGGDDFGEQLIGFVAASGVDASRVRRTDAPTGTALILVDGEGENTIVVVLGANGCLLPADAESAPIELGDALLVQLETPRETVEAALRLARARGATSILNAAPPRDYAPDLAALADVVLVNELERAALTDYERRPGQALIVSLGSRGVVAHTDDGTFERPARAVKAVDTTGAGDCFAGALAARLARGSPIIDALGYAVAAASICVTRPGAGPSMPTGAEVEQALRG
jgi:ribokinase